MNWTATPSVATMDSEVQGSEGMTLENTPVLVFNSKGKLLAQYPNIKATADEFQCSERTIYEYIKTGLLWKKKKVFLDLAL